jgi:nitroreductase
LAAGARDDVQMETWDVITSRRNVRAFSDRAIEPADLDRVLEAGRRSPSSMNWQPWDFVVVTDRAQLGELAKVWQGARHIAQSAATIAMVVPEPEDAMHRDWEQYDLGQATMAMMLTAADLGIGTAHAAVTDQNKAQQVLGFPDGRFCAYLLACGYPADRPLKPITKPDRRPFDEVVHRGRW